MLVWLQKMSQWPHFGHNKSFSQNKKKQQKNKTKKLAFFQADEQC